MPSATIYNENMEETVIITSSTWHSDLDLLKPDIMRIDAAQGDVHISITLKEQDIFNSPESIVDIFNALTTQMQNLSPIDCEKT